MILTLPKHWDQRYNELLERLKSKITDQEYEYLHPTGSQTGNFYGTVHKLPINGNINGFLLRKTNVLFLRVTLL